MKEFLFLFSKKFSVSSLYFCDEERGGSCSFYFACIFILTFLKTSCLFLFLVMERKMAVVIIAALVVWGCSAKEENVIVNGVSIDLSIKGLQHISKSANEYSVADVNIYVANSAGMVFSHVYSANPASVSVQVPKGVPCTIFALANLGNSRPLYKVEDIKALKISQEDIEGSNMVMQGEYGPHVFDDGDNIIVELIRNAAKIAVKFNFEQLDDDVSIQINQISLKNVPVNACPFVSNRAKIATDVIDGKKIDFPTANQLSQGTVFYMLENMQGTLLPENTLQHMKVWPESSLYSYICTYLEVSAYYSSNKKEGDVVYRYYLGKDPYTNFDIERNTQYTVNLIFKGKGGIEENSWRVDVDQLEDVVEPYVEFGVTAKEMYDLEEGEIPFVQVQGKGNLNVSVSDPSVVRLVSSNNEGVKIQALSPGKAILTAEIAGATSQCLIDVYKLRIEPRLPSLELYNHFYEDLQYEIYPPHASKMKVDICTSSASLTIGYNGVQNRVIPQFARESELPTEESITLSINGREDVSVKIPVVVKPMFTMASSLVANANLGSKTSVISLNLETSPRAVVDYTWAPNDGTMIYGNPGSNITVNKEEGSVSLPVPNAANGTYRLVASVIGDDNYGVDGNLQTDAVKYCDITVYETVYLVGVSKTMGRERVSANPQKWKYSNEVVAKWLSHPKSLLFPNGEVPVDYGFVYKGQTYANSHTEFHEDYVFTFIDGEPIYYALESDPRFFNGNIPEYYIEYFYLQPAVSPYIKGNMREGAKFMYITSLQFASGFSDENSPSWQKIFDYIYK